MRFVSVVLVLQLIGSSWTDVIPHCCLLDQVEARVDRQQQEREERKHVVKPDPFFKAKKKAAITKMEKQRAREDKQKRVVAVEKKVTQRKKRHVKLSQRTATGQPLVKNHINDILSRLQAEKKREGK